MNFAAIVVFAIAMGVATSKVVSRMVNKSQLNGGNPDLAFVDLLVELDRILGVMIIWVIMCTPVRIYCIYYCITETLVSFCAGILLYYHPSLLFPVSLPVINFQILSQTVCRLFDDY